MVNPSWWAFSKLVFDIFRLHKIKNKVKRTFHQYSEQFWQYVVVQKFVKHVRYGVPKATVQDRLKGMVLDKPRQMGPNPFLALKNENRIVSWFLNLVICGFLVKKQELLSTV